MTAQKIPSAQPANLAKHGFARFGYEFTGWNTKADGTGTKISDGAAFKDLAPAGKTATLYAQWKPIDTSVAMSSGTFYVRIHAGETAHINGLPAGTTYTVEEQPADGWTLIDSSGTVGQIAPRRTSQAWFKNKPDQNPSKLECSIKLYAYKTVDGTQPADGTSYKFQLRDSSGKVLQTKQSSTGGIVEFDSLRYYKDETRDDTGNHAYSIVEVKGDDTTLTYDTHTENVTVNVAEQSSTDGKKKTCCNSKDRL
ncbi:MAG: FctA domain-containing protein [Olsenella sp.]|nr:FctA domain-containing protein [Olsenella sp.]